MSRPSRVRSVRYRTLGSGTRLMDEMQVPAPLYYGGRGVAWTVRHWRVTGPSALFLVLWGDAGLGAAVLLFGVLLALFLTAPRGSPGGTPATASPGGPAGSLT
jgi:hypothetical protein